MTLCSTDRCNAESPIQICMLDLELISLVQAMAISAQLKLLNGCVHFGCLVWIISEIISARSLLLLIEQSGWCFKHNVGQLSRSTVQFVNCTPLGQMSLLLWITSLKCIMQFVVIRWVLEVSILRIEADQVKVMSTLNVRTFNSLQMEITFSISNWSNCVIHTVWRFTVLDKGNHVMIISPLISLVYDWCVVQKRWFPITSLRHGQILKFRKKPFQEVNGCRLAKIATRLTSLNTSVQHM